MALWNRISYSQRLFFWLLGYSILLVSCFICFQYYREKKFKTDELNVQLQLINLHILNKLESGNNAIEASKSQLHPFDELRISVIDTTGHVVYDNTLDTIPYASHLTREEIVQAFKSGSGYTVRRHSESTGKTYFYSATLGRNGYMVRSAVPYSVSLTELLRADFTFLWIMGGATLLMCILGYFATRRVGLHILRLNRFAESAERGERIYDTEPFPQDELGSISNHIVRLYANLQQAYADRDSEHRTALHEQQEKERIKKQLTNNINHELKTPVAAIQVCIETLLAHSNLSEEKREDFLRRCLSYTERLRHLLTDVALITRMDEAPSSVTRSTIDMAVIIAEVADDCAPIAASKGISITNSITSPLPVFGNAELLASVFRNLIDNAIAYSGGSSIHIRCISPGCSCHEPITLTIYDNGCGVSPEHLPFLFERFYRVDKGRSRATGGTGLGLSIVKNAVQLHGGRISVENRPGGGLMFTISIPQSIQNGETEE